MEVDPDAAPAVVRAFEMRTNGSTIRECRQHLQDNGIKRSYHSARALLASRLLAGADMVFGDLRGTVPAVVERDLWERVRRVAVPRPGAKIVERVVIDALRLSLDGTVGIEDAKTNFREARIAAERAQHELERTLTHYYARGSNMTELCVAGADLFDALVLDGGGVERLALAAFGSGDADDADRGRGGRRAGTCFGLRRAHS